ncbi:unnamed protein product [Owenia fusiformis]|uniref:Secreted protein n=1 Tax=Owenia fusiformis TaxID=6347 RepID=A0A8S4P391_OWEFU|nr:unnamed protein product [Owenia fusiformis]
MTHLCFILYALFQGLSETSRTEKKNKNNLVQKYLLLMLCLHVKISMDVSRKYTGQHKIQGVQKKRNPKKSLYLGKYLSICVHFFRKERRDYVCIAPAVS